MELAHPLRTVAPTLDGDVLRVLASAEAQFTVGDVQRLLGAYTAPGIRRVLRRLTEQGVVRQQQLGRTRGYELNRDHLAAPHIIALAHLRDELIDRLAAAVDTWVTQPVFAALFGSGARDDHASRSDLDLVFIFPAPSDLEQARSTVQDLAAASTRWTGNDTRPIVFDERQAMTAIHKEPLFRNIAEHGIVFAGDPLWLQRRLPRRRATSQ